VATELEDGQRLSVSLVKRMTGGESLRCERKYEHGFSFKPEYKLWLSGNHEPTITDTTNSIWNRLKKIPFKAYFPPESRINGLREKLRSEHAGAILTWLVNGCLEWQRQGLNEPKEVKDAVQSYRDAQDILHDFINENCLIRINEKVAVKELYKAYTEWATNNDVPAITKNKFRDRLIERGLTVLLGHANHKFWNGIRLLTEDERVTLVTQVTLFTEKSSIREIQEKVPENTTTKITKVTNQPQISNDLLINPCPTCGDTNPVVYGDSFACGTCHPELLNENIEK
jgi:putative DNA primase/helicase